MSTRPDPSSIRQKYYVQEGGRQTGPISHAELLGMLSSGRLTSENLVRLKVQDPWDPISAFVEPSDYPAVSLTSPAAVASVDSARARNPVSRSRSSITRSADQEPQAAFEITLPASLADSSLVTGVWEKLAEKVGGTGWLVAACACVVILVGRYLVSQSPLDGSSVYGEFQLYHQQAADLRSRSINDPAEWQRTLGTAKSRVRTLVKGLKNPQIGASAAQPAKQELLWAGESVLVKLLENPQLDAYSLQELETKFEFHMNEAQQLLSGGLRLSESVAIVSEKARTPFADSSGAPELSAPEVDAPRSGNNTVQPSKPGPATP